MAWNEPKTNWAPGDYFNLVDYNRIKNNVSYLMDLANTLYPSFEITAMGADKVNYTDYFYADEINVITENIDSICSKSYSFNVGTRTMYYDNNNFIGFADLNRIENACLLIYKGLNSQAYAKEKLSYRLGNMKGVKC